MPGEIHLLCRPIKCDALPAGSICIDAEDDRRAVPSADPVCLLHAGGEMHHLATARPESLLKDGACSFLARPVVEHIDVVRDRKLRLDRDGVPVARPDAVAVELKPLFVALVDQPPQSLPVHAGETLAEPLEELPDGHIAMVVHVQLAWLMAEEVGQVFAHRDTVHIDAARGDVKKLRGYGDAGVATTMATGKQNSGIWVSRLALMVKPARRASRSR